MSERRSSGSGVFSPDSVVSYYSRKFEEFGATARGVDWNSEESQQLRFAQLLRVLDEDAAHTSLTDYGCGYGALLDYLDDLGRSYPYQGFDLSPAMIAAARARHGMRPSCHFTTTAADLKPTTYTVASGIFNVKLACGADTWQQHVMQTLDAINKLSWKGFAFNMLTSYSDREKQRPDLFYADPMLFFDHCKRHFSARIALLHDYPLYEFTIVVRK